MPLNALLFWIKAWQPQALYWTREENGAIPPREECAFFCRWRHSGQRLPVRLVCVKAKETALCWWKYLHFVVAAGCYSVPSTTRYFMALTSLLCTFSDFRLLRVPAQLLTVELLPKRGKFSRCYLQDKYHSIRAGVKSNFLISVVLCLQNPAYLSAPSAGLDPATALSFQ